MQLKTMTDYAICILIYMQTKGGFVTRQEILAAMEIIDGPLITTLCRLRNVGWLAIKVETISIPEIMKLTQDTTQI